MHPYNLPPERLFSSHDESAADHAKKQRVYEEFCPLDRTPYKPLPWPHSTKTMPEVDQESGGSKPVGFEGDKGELGVRIERFAERSSALLQPHPIFGLLSDAEWQRWGYLLVDHHLRKFGK